ncbi:MAG TPA: hypothetical protein VH599_06310 [Ktedonobacterales bacterium]|jgi:hypothetical protein
MATATVNRKRTQVGWGFWLQWVVATSVCGAVGGVVISACIGALGDLGGNVVGNTASGLVAGIGQWLVLRQWLERAGWWIPATAGGYLLAASLLVLQGPLGENLGGVIATIALGFVPGILQWLLLRRQVARAGWWVLASTVSILAAFTAGVAASSGVGLKESELVFGLVSGIASGVVFGIMSGLVLGWLLRHPVAAPARGQTTTA